MWESAFQLCYQGPRVTVIYFIQPGRDVCFQLKPRNTEMQTEPKGRCRGDILRTCYPAEIIGSDNGGGRE